jgi:outer membrane protein
MTTTPSRWRKTDLFKLGLVTIVPLIITSSLPAQTATNRASVDLTLSNYLNQVVERNETLQSKLLEVEVARLKSKAEYGIFEPELTSSVERDFIKRQNTVEEERSQLSSKYEQNNVVYQSGIEGLVPSGMRIRLGYSLNDLNNNLQRTSGVTNGEYQSFFGVSVTQPLLKNGGEAATLAGIRIAALGSEIAYQEYRRQLMIMLSTAEAQYWNLFLAQEQVRYFQESLSTAEKILNDSRQRLEAGKGSELDVLESESGVALRQAKLSDAEQRRDEATMRLLSLASQTALSTNRFVRAVDQPQLGGAQPRFYDAWRQAIEFNPDYHVQRLKLIQEMVRLGYAKNQRLPELNLKGSYGLNGLADSPGNSWDDLQTGDDPAWTIGVEVRLPLAGGIKAANELAAAKLNVRGAELGLNDIENQIANSVETAMSKIQSASDGVQGYQALVSFTQNLLDSAFARLDVGRIDSRKVLEIEAELFEARNSVAEALVQYQRAELELELVQGVMLKKYQLDFSQSELTARTSKLLHGYGLTDEGYLSLLSDLKMEQQGPKRPATVIDTPEQIEAREALHAKMAEWPVTNVPPTKLEPPDPLRDALRKQTQEQR